MKKLIEIIVASSFILLSASCLAIDNKPTANQQTELAKLPKLNVLSEIYPPYQIMSKEGEIYGWSADKVKRLFERANVEYSAKVYPWARAYQLALTQKNTLIYSLLRTDLREDLFHWVAPLCTIDFSFYRAKNRSDIQVNSMDDAKKYLIATQKGQASTEYLLHLGFKEDKNLSTSYNNDNFIQMLFYGRVELIVLSAPFVQSLISTKAPHINQIEAVYPIRYLRQKLYLAANLNTPPAIIQKLQKAYEELKPQFDNVCLD